MSFYKTKTDDSSTEQILPGVSLTRARREPCIVCGHPTGDCTGDVEEDHIVLAEEAPKDSQLIQVRERITKKVKVAPGLPEIEVVVADAGSYVTVEKAKELGII